MFFLKYLFVQYKTEVGPTFGSRFMKAAGELLMGKPEDKGLADVRQDLRDSYYRTQADRQLPPAGSKDLEEWQDQSILVNQFRELEAPAVAKAVWKALTVFALLAVAISIPADKAGDWMGDKTAAWVKESKVVAWFKNRAHEKAVAAEEEEEKKVAASTTWEDCMQLIDDIHKKKLAEIPNLNVKSKVCDGMEKDRKAKGLDTAGYR